MEGAAYVGVRIPRLGLTIDRAFAVGSFIFDVVTVFLALFVARYLRFGASPGILDSDLLGTWAFFSIVIVLMSDMEGLYYTRTGVNRGMHGYRAIRIALLATVLYAVAMFIFRLPSEYFVHSRLVVVLNFFTLLACYLVLRIIAFPYVLRVLIRPFIRGKLRVLVFGCSDHYRNLRTLCMKSPIYRWYLNLVYLDESPPEEREEWIRFFVRKSREHETNDLCICDDEADFGDFAVSAWAMHQLGMYISYFSPIFQQLGYFDPWLSTDKRTAKIFFTGQMSRFSEVVWRLVDIVVSFVALVVLLPFFLLFALAIKLESRGPVFFVQDRVGLNLERFSFPKFRSMTHDPAGGHEKAHKEYFRKYANGQAADDDSENGFKLKSESRVTKVGRLLRRTSLDELPQFWCVLTGRMSLVGPRPCIPYELEHYEDWYKLRFTVKPGLTGIWQVYGRSRLPMDAAQFMDFCYVMNRSVGLNIRLILKTIPVMLSGKGGV